MYTFVGTLVYVCFTKTLFNNYVVVILNINFKISPNKFI